MCIIKFDSCQISVTSIVHIQTAVMTWKHFPHRLPLWWESTHKESAMRDVYIHLVVYPLQTVEQKLSSRWFVTPRGATVMKKALMAIDVTSNNGKYNRHV